MSLDLKLKMGGDLEYFIYLLKIGDLAISTEIHLNFKILHRAKIPFTYV